MNLTLVLPDALRELSLDGVPYVLIRKSALEALYPGGAAGDCIPRNPAARAAGPSASRPAPKKSKAPAPRSPVATRAAAAPAPETSKPESGALRATVLAAIQQKPGQTSLEIFEVIRQKISTTTSGSVYQAIKSWVKKDLVKGQATDEGTVGWHPVRAARKAVGGDTGTPKAPTLPNAPAIHSVPAGSADARCTA